MDTIARALVFGLGLLASPLPSVADCEAHPAGEPVARGWEALSQGELDRAEAVALSILAEIEGRPQEAPELRARALDLLVESHLQQGRFAALALSEWAAEAVAVRRELGEARGLAASLVRHGSLARERFDIGAAEALLGEALELLEEADGDCPRWLARGLTELGILALEQRRLEAAKALGGRSLDLLRRELDGGSPEEAAALSLLAGVASLQRQWDLALAQFQEALEIRRRVRPAGHPEIARGVRSLAYAHSGLGDFSLAHRYAQEAVALFEAHHPGHPDLGHALNTLALAARDSGHYLDARRHFERTLGLWEDAYGPEHPNVAGVLNNLGNLHRLMGDLERAEQHLRRSLAIRQAHFGDHHPLVAQGLINLGALFHDRGDYAAAERPLRQVVALYEQEEGPQGELRAAFALNNLGNTLRGSGKLEESKAVLGRAIDILLASGSHRYQAAPPLNNLALVQQLEGELAAASQTLGKALDLWRGHFGPTNPQSTVYLDNMAWLRLQAGETATAFGLALEADEVTGNHLRLTARGLSEREALTLAHSQVAGLAVALTLASYGSLDEMHVAQLWDAVARSRSVVLDEMVERQRASRAPDPAILERHQYLVVAAGALAGLMVRGPAADEEDFAERIAVAQREVETAERSLAEVSARYRQELERSRAGLAEVAAALPAGGALVAYKRYLSREHPAVPGKKSARYLAFVLPPSAASARVVAIGEAADIEPLVAEWLREAGRSDAAARGAAGLDAYRAAGGALRQAVWDPVAAHLEGASAIWVVPDADLHLVHFSVLPDSRFAYLLETGPPLHLLTSESDLLDPGPTPQGHGLLALGGADFEARLDFDAGPETPLGEVDAAPLPSTLAPLASLRSTCERFPDLRFGALRHSDAEAREVAAIWEAGAGPPAPSEAAAAHLLTGAAASEAAFKRLAPGRRALHLATHGFFVDGGCLPPATGRGVGGLAPVRQSQGFPPEAADHPLRLSGLALAGANRRHQATTVGEDGVLTAEEIAVMDLSTVELAVLSACGTGLGEIDAAGALFGLRRAFLIAGVRSLVTSLWSVDDRATREWMAALYRGRIEGGLGTAEAARQASLTVLQTRREAGQSDHPFYWGAFVQVGDWR